MTFPDIATSLNVVDIAAEVGHFGFTPVRSVVGARMGGWPVRELNGEGAGAAGSSLWELERSGAQRGEDWEGLREYGKGTQCVWRGSK